VWRPQGAGGEDHEIGLEEEASPTGYLHTLDATDPLSPTLESNGHNPGLESKPPSKKPRKYRSGRIVLGVDGAGEAVTGAALDAG
jgi:hypothetical protein